eukprot:gnl/TRDRNA2_/TRDRNA2_149365_c0_seq1.p1 gnl/TRDRNA2_/TRDRNA2_149365_c0~~gnl/TRDRNA2_/TRDRNA2_149365_c0_seq1.p1  ORF type:complete len:337 (+),score=36.31 gnl/TRDRNA2_/TRDRNA2_149365_c0_seq1:1-1011(+)
MSAPSTRLLSGSEDGTASVWTSSGIRLAHVRHQGPVHSVCFSPSTSQQFCSGSLDGYAVVWDIASCEASCRIRHSAGVRAVCWAGDRIWSGDLSGCARCSSVDGVEIYSWQPCPVALTAVVLASAMRPTLIMSAKNGSVTAWDADLLEPLCSLDAGTYAVNALAARGMLVAAGGVEAIVKLFDLRSEMLVHSFGTGTRWDAALQSNSNVGQAAKAIYASEGHAFAVTGVCFVDAHTVASSGADRTVRLWDLRQLRTPVLCRGHSLAVLAVASDAGRLFSSSDDMSIREWALDGQTSQTLADLHTGPIFGLAVQTCESSTVALDDDVSGEACLKSQM